MKFFRQRFCIAIASSFCVLVNLDTLLFGQDTTNEKAKRIQNLIEYAETKRLEMNVSGVGLGIVVDGKVAYVGGLGYRDVAAQIPVTKDSLFAIGSNTKSFTGLLVSKLVSSGSLDWDEPIATYIPGLELSDEYVSRHVTLADACSHMTGLARADHLWKGKRVSREQVFEQAMKLPFAHSLRKEFSYNNHMYVVVGKVIETVTDMTWENNVRNHILKPLGMQDTFVTYDEFLKHPEKTLGYLDDGKTVIPHLDITNIAPAGAISSTPRDLLKWVLLWVNDVEIDGNELISRAAYAHYTVPRSATMMPSGEWMYYWAGWGEKFVDGQMELRHSGGIDGQNSTILIRPSAGFGIFVLTNQRSDYKDMVIERAEQLFLD